MLAKIALGLDLIATAFAIGVTLWFFFIQSPALIKTMGKDKFIPLQMRLVIVLFKTLTITIVVIFAASLIHETSFLSAPVLFAGLSLLAVLINKFWVLPRALKAGGRARKDSSSRGDQISATKFASLGAGQASKFWHRMVVFFVLLMVSGLIPHLLLLVFRSK